MTHEHDIGFDLADAIRRAFCAVFCPCSKHRKTRRRCTVTAKFGSQRLSFTYYEGDTIMAIVKKDGGPLKFDISGFVSDSGNPVTDKDIPVLSSSDETIATIAPDPADPDGQDGVITLLGTVSPEGTEVVLKASFPAQKFGTPFEVVGHLTVIEPPAAGATAAISGPGVVEGA